jgi:phenylalanyl-tRNA synthetase alpha chain
MKEKIEKLLAEIDILSPISKEEVEELRIKYLSKKGEISTLFNDFRNVANEEKKVVGQLLNDLKNKAQDKINELKETFDNQQNNTNDLDLTRSSSPIELGTRHPLSIVKNEIVDIFARIGFTISEGPEIEDDWHVFSALNFPPNILHAICKIHSLSKKILMSCCVRIPHRYKLA